MRKVKAASALARPLTLSLAMPPTVMTQPKASSIRLRMRRLAT